MAVVWKELLRLLQKELNRRLEAASKADPLKQPDELLRRDHARLAKSMDRLLSAYQEGLVSLEQLRSRMPELRKQLQAVQAEVQSLESATSNHTQCLRVIETLADFRGRLRASAYTLEVAERPKILRRLVKEVLVGKDTITIRHSIRIPNAGPDPSGLSGTLSLPHASQQRPTPQPGPHYLLR